MAHGDDKGLRLPRRSPGADRDRADLPQRRRAGQVLGAAQSMAEEWRANGLRVKVDDATTYDPVRSPITSCAGAGACRDRSRDLAAEHVTVARRDTGRSRRWLRCRRSALDDRWPTSSAGVRRRRLVPRREHARGRYVRGAARRDHRCGWVRDRAWCGSADCEAKVKADTKATIRFLPLEAEDPGAACSVCGEPGIDRATWAVAY